MNATSKIFLFNLAFFWDPEHPVENHCNKYIVKTPVFLLYCKAEQQIICQQYIIYSIYIVFYFNSLRSVNNNKKAISVSPGFCLPQ